MLAWWPPGPAWPELAAPGLLQKPGRAPGPGLAQVSARCFVLKALLEGDIPLWGEELTVLAVDPVPDPRQRQVLDLYFGRDLTLSDIARRLGISLRRSAPTNNGITAWPGMS